MKKYQYYDAHFFKYMRKIGLMLLPLLTTVSLHAFTQNKLTINLKNEKMVRLFQIIQQETDYQFIYSNEDLATVPLITVKLTEAPIVDILNQCFKDSGLQYRLSNKTIVVSKITSSAHSQQRIITGKVLDENGKAIEGVTVRVKGGQVDVSTDNEGNYRISVYQSGNVLIFSILGYDPLEAAIGNQSSMNVVLKETISDLDEVVVIGYGTQKKVNLTGSVSTVSNEELVRRPAGQTSSALQGIVPGLTVTQRSGQPGRDNGGLRIRGVGTLGNSDPLVIIDGVEASLNNIDPNEIEGISVLKDAASAAIYGSRAANGVILITTKRATAKGFNLNYNMYAGGQMPTDMPDVVNALDHMNMINEAYTNVGRSPLYSDQVIEEYISQGPTNRDRYPDTDWEKLTLKSAGLMQSHYIGLNGGNDHVKVLGSFTYLDQDGIILNTNFKRYNLRLNSDVMLNKRFSMAMDVFLRRTELTEPSSGTADIFHWMRRIPANQTGLLSTGQWGEGWNGINPIAMAKDGGLNVESALSGIINLNLKYSPIKWLTASLIYAPKFNDPHNKSFSNIIQSYRWDGSPSYAVPAINNLNEEFSREWNNNFRATLTVNKTFAHTHQLDVLAGFQQEDQRSNNLTAYRERFILPEYQEINAGNRLNERTGGTASHWSLQSFFGRINYNFKEKYLFEANARYDGSSRFASGNKYAFFPSLSAGWRITQESFMNRFTGVLTDMKLRVSWGRLGNQNIEGGLYPFASFVKIGESNYVFGSAQTTGASLNDMANPEIKWETTEMTNIGLDLNLFSKFTLTYDYFYRRTTDILLRLDIPTMLGLTAPFQNAGVVENKGWDLSIGYRDQADDFNYGITVNLSDVKNKVLDMRGIQRTGRQVSREGFPINSFYGYKAIGYFQTTDEVTNSPKQFDDVAPGDIKYADVNGDNIITTADQVIIGSPIPRYTYSANFDLGYKNLDMAVFFQGVGKVDGFLFGHGIMPFFNGSTAQEQHKNHWTPDNPDAAFPRLAFEEANNTQNSTFWQKSAAYLRLKNVQVGYSFSSNQLKNKLQKLRIYAGGQNLLTLANFWEGYDPEAPVSDGGWYPQTRIFTIGIDARF